MERIDKQEKKKGGLNRLFFYDALSNFTFTFSSFCRA